MLLFFSVNVKRHINNTCHMNCFRWGCAQMRSVSVGVFYPWCVHSTQAAPELQTAAWNTGAGRGVQRCYPRGKKGEKSKIQTWPSCYIPTFIIYMPNLFFLPGFRTLWNPHRSNEIGWRGIIRWTRENRQHQWVHCHLKTFLQTLSGNCLVSSSMMPAVRMGWWISEPLSGY